jgi:hypothetical protein
MLRQPTVVPSIQSNLQSSQRASQVPSANTNFYANGLPASESRLTNVDSGPSHANTHFIGSDTFLGIAQRLSDNPITNDEIMHLFNSEDLSSWVGGEYQFSGGL